MNLNDVVEAQSVVSAPHGAFPLHTGEQVRFRDGTMIYSARMDPDGVVTYFVEPSTASTAACPPPTVLHEKTSSWELLAMPLNVAVPLLMCIAWVMFGLSRIDKIANAWRRSELGFKWLKPLLPRVGTFLLAPLAVLLGMGFGALVVRCIEWASDAKGHAGSEMYTVMMFLGAVFITFVGVAMFHDLYKAK